MRGRVTTYPENVIFKEEWRLSCLEKSFYPYLFRSVAPMMKSLLSCSGIAATVLMSTVQWLGFPLALSAQSTPLTIPQTPSTNNPAMPQPRDMVAPGDQVPQASDALKQPNIDDVRNDPNQLTTWVCNSGDKMVAVEVKDISFWNNLTEESKNWQCNQKLADISAGKKTFSCEPTETMGLISVYWLQGEGSQDQINTWMNALANKYNMVCTTSKTNKVWE
jgi:hypothetical protein